MRPGGAFSSKEGTHSRRNPQPWRRLMRGWMAALLMGLELALMLKPLTGVSEASPPATQETAPAPVQAAPAPVPLGPPGLPGRPPTQAELLERLIVGEVETRHQLARKKAGLGALLLDPELREAAQAFAEGHCTLKADISHTHRLPNGLNLWSFYPSSRFQLLERWGNNLGRVDWIVHGGGADALPSADQVVSQLMSGWLKSPGHRANILGKSFTHMGIGSTLCKLKPGHTRVYAVGGFVRAMR